jgi:hypothetical protein
MISNQLIQHFFTKCSDEIRDAVWVDIQNVADYYLQSDQEIWNIDKDFPNLAPPWPHFIMSYHHPGRWRSLGKQIEGDEPANVLVVMNVLPPPPTTIAAAISPATRWVVNASVWASLLRTKFCLCGIQWLCLTPTGEWLQPNEALLRLIQITAGGNGFDDLSLAPGGKDLRRRTLFWLLDGNFNPVAPDYLERKLSDPELHQQFALEMSTNINTYMNPALLAVCFTHCRNVEIISAQANRAERRRMQRHGKAGGVTWRLLDIHPMRKIPDGARRDGAESSLSRALHICRGHFKDYRDGRGLFGKYQGLYW